MGRLKWLFTSMLSILVIGQYNCVSIYLKMKITDNLVSKKHKLMTIATKFNVVFQE